MAIDSPIAPFVGGSGRVGLLLCRFQFLSPGDGSPSNFFRSADSAVGRELPLPQINLKLWAGASLHRDSSEARSLPEATGCEIKRGAACASRSSALRKCRRIPTFFKPSIEDYGGRIRITIE